jgi:hypothetical protein
VQRLWPTILDRGELATIELASPLGASLVVELFNVAGRRILGEALGAMEPGPHRLLWVFAEVCTSVI